MKESSSSYIVLFYIVLNYIQGNFVKVFQAKVYRKLMYNISCNDLLAFFPNISLIVPFTFHQSGNQPFSFHDFPPTCNKLICNGTKNKYGNESSSNILLILHSSTKHSHSSHFSSASHTPHTPHTPHQTHFKRWSSNSSLFFQSLFPGDFLCGFSFWLQVRSMSSWLSRKWTKMRKTSRMFYKTMLSRSVI